MYKRLFILYYKPGSTFGGTSRSFPQLVILPLTHATLYLHIYGQNATRYIYGNPSQNFHQISPVFPIPPDLSRDANQGGRERRLRFFQVAGLSGRHAGRRSPCVRLHTLAARPCPPPPASAPPPPPHFSSRRTLPFLSPSPPHPPLPPLRPLAAHPPPPRLCPPSTRGGPLLHFSSRSPPAPT